MRHFYFATKRVRASVILAVGCLLMLVFLPARLSAPVTAQRGSGISPDIVVIPPGNAYRQTNLVSDLGGLAFLLDPFMVNPWGISMTASSPFWVVNNGNSTTRLLRGDVGGSPLVFNPSPQTLTLPGGPTGTVANLTASDFNFVPTSGGSPVKAAFIFDSVNGNITAWNPAQGNSAKVIVANPGHVYTGIAIANNGSVNRLYAADNANNKIDVFDGNFAPTTVPGGFLDPTIPVGFSVHNIQNLSGSLYVTYAKPQASPPFVENGLGKGFVRKFSADGVRDMTFTANGSAISPVVPLDAPWGLAIAPASFGSAGGTLLIGNFSNNGIINAFNPSTGAFIGTLQNEGGQNISNDGLWALVFGNGGNGGDPGTLYFTAGTAVEQHGLFGSLKPTTSSATSLIQLVSDDFTISETSGRIDITVTRLGDVSGPATVNLTTYDQSQPSGRASQKSDYEIALAKVTFSPGDTSKTVRILIIDDPFVEGTEVVNLALSNPTGAGVGLGSPNQALLKITDNDSSPPSFNFIDGTNYFVREQYLDFLNREPDLAGLAFWGNNIDSCTTTPCLEVKRVDTSAAFFLSIEFQRTGLIAYLANKAAFGNLPPSTGAPVPILYGQFEKDTQQLQKDLVFGQPAFDAQLDANKTAYFNDFVSRPDFVDKFGGMTNAQYVDALLTSAGIDPPNVRLLVATLTNAQENPPTTPTTSTGAARPASSGTAKFRLNAAQNAMTFTATINNIDITGSQTTDVNDNLIAAHIHAGAAVTPTTNGAVVWGFFGSPFNDNTPNDQVFAPLSSGVGGNFSGKWDAPEGNATTLAAQLANIREGRSYINFHTTQFGGGEIRGNILAATTFRDSLLNGLSATPATETRATVLRKIAESEEFALNESNRAFVLMEYFGYLRRDPDIPGFTFWLNKLNAANGNFVTAEMVKAFITSGDYRQRFGP